MPQDRDAAASSAPALFASERDAEAKRRDRDALLAQIALLEDEWRTGMERDTLVLLDHAFAKLAALEEALARESREPRG